MRKTLFRIENFLVHKYRQLTRVAEHQRRRVELGLNVIFADKDMQSRQGIRFLELQLLLTEFLTRRIQNNPDYAKNMARQLWNVVKNCDQITYEEPGTAEAYAFLHFLDRYRRFQITFQALHQARLMPIKSKRIDILDIGTGPGPSMYAISDFYGEALPKLSKAEMSWGDTRFLIDYVERSREFRNWLHHFTEHANAFSPSTQPWWVPYHHGTFSDFRNLEFNQVQTYMDYDDDGDYRMQRNLIKRRFDVVVFSNFLTTEEQAKNFATEIENCARYLRNKGILIVVGALGSSKKYKNIYEEISRIVVSGQYSNHRIIAKCERIEIANSILSYSWNDAFGKRLKSCMGSVFANLERQAHADIPKEAFDMLTKTLKPEYSKSIDWQMLVFRKLARPRRAKTIENVVQN